MSAECVLDASAIVALLYGERGAEQVKALLDTACVSAVNITEIIAKLVRDGSSAEEARSMIEALEVNIVAFDSEAAYAAGNLVLVTKATGLSLGDRACIALAMQLGVPAITAESRWAKIKSAGIPIQLIR